MDGSRFDELTVSLATGRTRRSVAKALAAALFGGAAAAVGRGAVSARFVCREQGVGCGKAAECCSQVCNPKDKTGRRRCGCQPVQSACSSSGDCCSGNCVNGICCDGEGASCVDDSSCCFSLFCVDATCQSCQPLLSTCAAGGDCCSGSCVNNLCCKGVGAQCFDDPDCCGTLFCVLGACAEG